MYEVQQYTSKALPPGLACQFSSFVRLIWLNDLKGDDRFWDLLKSEETVDHFVIAERDVLISHALVRQRIINHAGEAYRLYGVGGVFTYPAFRGEGHGRRVVAAATEFIRSSDADVGMLFAMPSLTPFYAAHGWSVLSPAPAIAYGDPAHPDMDEGAFSMMIMLSAKAQAHRRDFTYGPIYVGEFMW